MCSLTFGNRFEYNNEKFLRMLHLIEEAFNIGAGLTSQVAHKNLIVSKNETSWLLNKNHCLGGSEEIKKPHSIWCFRQKCHVAFDAGIMNQFG